MLTTHDRLHHPDYQTFCDAIGVLSLPLSGSEIHGILCGYSCAGELQKAESYVRALVSHVRDADYKKALLALFNVYSQSQQQITTLDFEFQLLIPGDDASLRDRACALSQWCEGFSQALQHAGIHSQHYQDEEAQNAATHIVEFAKLDYEALEVDEADEFALMEINEYVRMAVLRIHSDLKHQGLVQNTHEKTH